MLNSFNIRECFVAMERNLEASCRAYLQDTDPANNEATNPQRIPARRRSVAEEKLFSVDGEIEEIGHDGYDFSESAKRVKFDQRRS